MCDLAAEAASCFTEALDTSDLDLRVWVANLSASPGSMAPDFRALAVSFFT
jgi:hypothetical protein